jgi:hypothetical protein
MIYVNYDQNPIAISFEEEGTQALGFSIQRELAATNQGAWGHPAGKINL